MEATGRMEHQSHIAAQLQSKSLPVSPRWLAQFLASQRNERPLSALTQTALFRVLASDLRDTLSPAALLPANIFDVHTQERRLVGPIPVQVLDVEDIGTSTWAQIEAIERIERGETVRGREIIRAVNVGDDDEQQQQQQQETDRSSAASRAHAASASLEGSARGPHRLLVEDAAGTRAVAFELRQIREIGAGTLSIGAKLVLQNATVARGMILLTPESVTVLGGKIDAMDLAWRQGRKARLQDSLKEAQRPQQ